LGDTVKLTATSDGTETKLTDSIRLTGAPSIYAGRSLYCVTAADSQNVGEWREVVDSSDDFVTVNPGFPVAITAGDTFHLTDERDRGFSPDEILAAINDAITDAGSYCKVPVTAELATPFDRDSPELDIPTTISEVARVYWVDTNSNNSVRDVPSAPGVESDGWTLLPGRKLRIVGPVRGPLNGMSVTLWGYGPPPPLTDDTDTTDVPTEWLEAQTVAYLMVQGLDRDPTRERRASFFQGLADNRRPSLFLYRDPGSRAVIP
jgi:hypothetical protein